MKITLSRLSSFKHPSATVINPVDNHLPFSSIHVLRQITFLRSIVLYLLGTIIHMSIHVHMQMVLPSCDKSHCINKQVTSGRLFFFKPLLVAPFQKNLTHSGKNPHVIWHTTKITSSISIPLHTPVVFKMGYSLHVIECEAYNKNT